MFLLLAPCQWGSHPDSITHTLMINYSMIIGMIFSIVLNIKLKIYDFTKMAVSPLIMIRFEKFEIVYIQDFDPNLADVITTSREMTSRARVSDNNSYLAPSCCSDTQSHGRSNHDVTVAPILTSRRCFYLRSLPRSWMTSDTEKALKWPKMVRF